jgi:hypothetical protein
MLFLVITETRDSIVGERVPQLRADVEKAVKRVTASGKMQAGGILGGRRGAFMLLEMETAKDTLELLGGEILDNMKVELYPIISFQEIGEFFAKDAARLQK